MLSQQPDIQNRANAAAAAKEVIGHMGHKVVEQKFAALPVLHEAFGHRRTVRPDLVQHPVDGFHILPDVEMQFEMNSAGGIKGDIMVVFSPLYPPTQCLQRRHCTIQIRLVNEHVHIAAGAHPRLRIQAAQKRTLEGHKRNSGFLKAAANLAEGMVQLHVAENCLHFRLLELLQRCAGG